LPTPTNADETSTVAHWFTKHGEKVQREISRPPAVKYYNLYMGAVDMFDQYRSYVQMDLRTKKFWHPLFWFIVEAALINAWLLYKSTRVLAMLPLEYTMFTLRKSIALALANEWEMMGCKHQTPIVSPSKTIEKCPAQSRLHLRKLNTDGTRFTAPDKHLSKCELIPPKEGSNLKVRQMRCQHCKKRRSVYWCSEYGKPLCQGVCYQTYHTLGAAKKDENVL
jgi:hypothetical protein